MLILYYSVFWAGGLTLHNKQYLILSYLIERLHKQFCISVLNVKRSTNYFAIYGELRIVLCDVCLFKVKCIFFQLKITFSHVCMLIIMYLILHNY